jgi:hypothetical protein
MTNKSWRPDSIAEVARRAAMGADRFDPAVREFLDTWQSLSSAERDAALAEEPVPLGGVKDAYIAAVAEHLARVDRRPIPDWTEKPERFLKEPFFAGGLESLKAILIVESPIAFRRRLIFVSADALSRPPRAFAEGEAG